MLRLILELKQTYRVSELRITGRSVRVETAVSWALFGGDCGLVDETWDTDAVLVGDANEIALLNAEQLLEVLGLDRGDILAQSNLQNGGGVDLAGVFVGLHFQELEHQVGIIGLD